MQESDIEDGNFEARGHRQDAPLTVAQLNWYIKGVLEEAVPKVWVEGEVSDLSQPSSGHIYFSLKDEDSQVRAVIWRNTAAKLPFKLKNGLSIVCCGAVEVYPPRGSYQLIVRQIQPLGIGPLQLAFQQLHQKLSALGLFDPQLKRELPRFPKRIGFVTSPSGAAIHDFLQAATQLWSDFTLTVIPATVQGETAARDIVKGIQAAQRITPALNVLIVGRGGGSIEDLWCFNEESVVKAIRACSIPVVSAVGHEIDVTLSDLAADKRALTPTDAAQVVLPNRKEILSRLSQTRMRSDGTIRNRLKSLRQRIESLSGRSVLARPHEIHLPRRQTIDQCDLRARRAIWALLSAKQELLSGKSRAIAALSPLNVLARGYSLTRLASNLQTIKQPTNVQIGDAIESLLHQGRIVSRVEEIQANRDA